MSTNTTGRQRGWLLGRAGAAIVLLAVIGLGVSCIKQQDEVLVQPEEQDEQQREQQK